MALVNYATREISAKVVYYGPGLSGKTTNIQQVFNKVKPKNKGKLISLSTQGDRTLFFDFLPVELGEIRGFKTRFHLYTVPGQVFYNSTRKLVLKGVDGVVFVADSQRMMMEENIQSLDNLRANLAEIGVRADRLPVIIQYNKRDLPNAATVEEMQGYLNSSGLPYFEATALTGEGVLPTLTAIVKFIMHDLKKDPGSHNLNLEEMTGEETPAMAVPEAAASPAAPEGPEAAEDTGVRAVEPSVEAEKAVGTGAVVEPSPSAEEEDKAAAEEVSVTAIGPGAPPPPALRREFVIPLKISTAEGERDLALSVSLEIGLHGEGAGRITRVEAFQPRQEEPPGTSGPAELPSEAATHEKKKTMIQKILGM